MRQIGSPDEYRESNDRHYEYSLWYRPASSFTVPDDYLKISPPSKDYPFGTVSYAKPLSREQISAFELSPLDPNDPINIEKEYRKFHEKFMSEFTKSDENYRSPKGFVVTRSTVPGVEWQLTQFCKDQPSGHIDFSDFNELTRTIWGMERNNSDESKNKK